MPDLSQTIWNTSEEISDALNIATGLEKALLHQLEDLLVKAGPAAEHPILAIVEAQGHYMRQAERLAASIAMQAREVRA